MRALTWHGPRDVRVETVDDPRIEAPTDVIVRVLSTAICGSDLHVYHDREKGQDPGTVMGHEFVGQVADVGRAVRGLESGVLVVSPFSTSCGACFYCERGLTARCERGAVYGWVSRGVGLQGAQAEYVRVPLADATLVRVPGGLSADDALLAGDVLSTGWFCATSAGAGAGRIAAVVGCGPVGALGALAARELGCERVLAIDRVPERLALAQRFGAEPVDFSRVDPVEAVRAATGGRGADCVLECVGSPQATRLAVDLARPGATIAAAGVHTESTFAFSPVEAYDKNLTYVAGRCSARAGLEAMLVRLAERRWELAALVSHRLELADAVRGYDLFDRKLEGCTKVLLRA